MPPQPSAQTMDCGGKQYGGGFYSSADGINASFFYFLNGSQTCDSIQGLTAVVRVQTSTITVCKLRFALL